MWTSLGIYRGINFYNYKFKKEQKIKSINYSYQDCLKTALQWGLIYAIPFTFLRVGEKELERLQINLKHDFSAMESSNYYVIW